MKSTFLSAVLLAVVAAPAAFHATPAQAGSLDNAALACYVDTYAYDQLVNDYCESVWTPAHGNRNSVAHFEVTGLAAGSYSYSWTPSSCGSSAQCNIAIFAEGTRSATVTVHDNGTGDTKTVSATAEYIDGWD